MKHSIVWSLVARVAGLCCGLGTSSVMAQSYPAKPVRIIVPFAQGGRAGSRRMGCRWGGDGARPPGWMRWIASIAAKLACAGAMVFALPVVAQTYPSKPVRIIVPFAPGGGVDLVARILAQRLTEGMKQTFFVENRAGASGMIGAEFVAKSPPDGYTLFVGSQTTQAVVPAIYAGRVSYDPVRDFAPITVIASSPLLLAIHPSLPVRTVKDLIALAKSRPGQLTFGAAFGGSPHMAGELFKLMAGVNMLFVPYKGEGPAVADALGGQISMVFSNIPVVLPQVRAGRLRGIAVTSPERMPNASDIPTVSESGLPGYDMATWFGLFGPAATPRDIIVKLQSEAARGLNVPEVRDKMLGQGLFVVADTPEQFNALLKKEIPRWTKVVKDAGLKPE
jgi:tripartite-type tricarboxylate transporter receptor subunit TctC